MRNIFNLFALILAMSLMFSCHSLYNRRKNLLYSENNANIDSIYVSNIDGFVIAKFKPKKGVTDHKISLTNFSPDIYDCEFGCPFVFKQNSVYVFIIINNYFSKAIRIDTDSNGGVKSVEDMKISD